MRKMRSRAVLVSSLAMTLGACRSGAPKGENKGETDAAPSAKPVASVTQGEGPPSPKPEETEKAAREVFAAWLAAQNASDFPAYEKLYAHKFTGIKRSGPRTRTMDRAAWLSDRKSMFEKPFEVAAKDVVVHVEAGVTAISFEQTWQSASYKDSGEKMLLLVKEAEGLRVSREEMLNSKEASPKNLASLPFERAATGLRVGERFALLLPEAPDLGWLEGHPEYVETNLARRSVKKGALPEALEKRLEAEYEIFEASGKRCVAKAERFDVVAHVVPHFGLLSTWEDTYAGDEGRTPKPIPRGKRALELWSLALGHPAGGGLKLALVLGKNECTDPLWGRVLDAKGPSPYPRSSPASDELVELRAFLAKTKEVKAADAIARAEGDAAPDGTWGGDRGTFHRFASPGGGVTFVARLTGSGGCSSSAPWSLGFVAPRIGGALSLLTKSSEMASPIESLVDLDADGRPEAITRDGILAVTPDGYAYIVDHAPPSYDCPC